MKRKEGQENRGDEWKPRPLFHQTSLCVDFANSPVPFPCSSDRLEQSGLGIQYRRTTLETLETLFINKTSDIEELTTPCLQSLP
jgi:hypothetical protein